MTIDSPSPTERHSGLATALNVVVSPKEAFETLRIVPMWGWAFLISTVLSIIGSILVGPAQLHAIHGAMAAQFAQTPNLTEAQRSAQLAMTDKFAAFGWTLIPFVIAIVCALQALIMLVFNAIGSGSATFKQLWAVAVNISIPGFALYSLILGVIAMVRGPAGFNNSSDIFLSFPSLAWIVPNAGVKTVAFLFYFNPFFLWAAFLIAMAMVIVAKVPKMHAYLAAAAIFLGGALIQMVTAR